MKWFKLLAILSILVVSGGSFDQEPSIHDDQPYVGF